MRTAVAEADDAVAGYYVGLVGVVAGVVAVVVVVGVEAGEVVVVVAADVPLRRLCVVGVVVDDGLAAVGAAAATAAVDVHRWDRAADVLGAGPVT